MSVTIDPELIKFKSTVSGALSSMNSTVSTLTSKISELISINSSTQSSISSVYHSENQGEVLDKFTKINDIYNKISTSLESDLKPILDKSSLLIDTITQLERLKKEIDDLIAQIAAARASLIDSDDESAAAHNAAIYAKINELQRQLDAKIEEFKSLHQKALSDLAALKAFDATLSFVSQFKPVDMSSLSQYLTGSSFEKYTFTASNGVKFDYYLYVPEYSTDVDKLPVHIYLHGSGENGSGVLKHAVPKLLNNGLQTNGIVICPQARDNLKFGNDDFQHAIVELTSNVVKTYNADSSRVSLSGHSAGAHGGYQMISKYPGYFSAFIPISGSADRMVSKDSNSWQALSQVDVWAFHGKNDGKVKHSEAVDVVNTLNSMGSNKVDLYSFDAGHGGVQNDTFESKYSYQGGEEVNPLDWAMAQRNDD